MKVMTAFAPFILIFLKNFLHFKNPFSAQKPAKAIEKYMVEIKLKYLC
jgi:hypothetical protein